MDFSAFLFEEIADIILISLERETLNDDFIVIGVFLNSRWFGSFSSDLGGRLFSVGFNGFFFIFLFFFIIFFLFNFDLGDLLGDNWGGDFLGSRGRGNGFNSLFNNWLGFLFFIRVIIRIFLDNWLGGNLSSSFRDSSFGYYGGSGGLFGNNRFGGLRIII